MATYRELHGKAVKTVTTNPTDDAAEGQIWFNSTDNTFKSIVASEAWASAAPLNAARRGLAAGGTSTTGLAFAGTGDTDATEEYNGSGWSIGGNLTQVRISTAGCGPNSAGLCFGGNIPPVTNATEHYNGTSWTNGGALAAAVGYLSGCGTQTAGLAFGGDVAPGIQTKTQEYNGSSWSEGGTLSTGRSQLGGAGIQTSALGFGGYISSPTPVTAATEEYNGSSWTTGGSMNTGRLLMGGSGTSSSSALAFGGLEPSNSTKTEKYDGTTWSETGDMATARGRLGGFGSQTSAVACGGKADGPALSNTEEFTASAQLVTAGAWSSGGNLNTARSGLGGFGESHSTAVAFAGRDTPIYQVTEEYNGSTWTSVNNYPQTVVNVGATGTLTAGLGLGGLNPPSIPSFPTTGRVTAHYDGTDWTAGGTYVYDAWGTGMAGTQTAAIASGGHNYPMPPGNRNNSAEYNGSAWTSGNTMSQVRAIFATGGSQTASFACGGRSSPGVEDPTNATEEYDGTNWTSGGNYLVSVKENTGAGGPQTAGYNAGGSAPSSTAITGSYDGTAWSTAPSLPAAQNTSGSTTNNTSPAGAMIFGGGEDKDGTYEFTAESTSLNVKTLTQS